ncbi:uncharacterized protein LOC116344491 [Contarinia nasturtii]|uniref:uncharacterized protein LOC116344491 n=1 Tax=Contarinia nasturtii TaxID=265458 RepID=UPI0012D3E4F8|nr:uncharacterized protein LOC116344491 [Contarinia nasturtii]
MNITFNINHKTNKYSLRSIAFELCAEIFPNGSFEWFELHYFGSNISSMRGRSYFCNELSLPLKMRSKIMGTLQLINIQFEAFRSEQNEEFSKAIVCGDETSRRDSYSVTTVICVSVTVLIMTIWGLKFIFDSKKMELFKKDLSKSHLQKYSKPSPLPRCLSIHNSFSSE